jgi:uncharacterized protein (TIGR02391 family)
LDPQPAQVALDIARKLQAAASEKPTTVRPEALSQDPVALFDALITEAELREETRLLFVNGHYPQAVEEGFKYLNNLVKRRTSSDADGAGLMTKAFSPTSPMLKLSELRSQSQLNQQQGYMKILEGSMTGIRNPRAHEHRYLDDPRTALELLTLCNHLVRSVQTAKRARKKSATP